MRDTIFAIHSGVRYLVLLAAVVAAIAAALSLRRGALTPMAERSGRAFTILLDAQVALGIVLVFLWDFYPALTGHIVMMTLAIAVAHGLAKAVRRRPEGSRPALQLAAVLVPLVLLIGGILAIGRSVI